MSPSRALFLKEKLGAFEVGTKDLPVPGPGEIVVKEAAVGLNPVDWKIQAYGLYASEYPAILGGDAAGEVESVGEGVTHFKKGDKVFHQGSPMIGGDYAAFQEYVLVPADIVFKLPDNITFEQAASLPVCVSTTVIPLYSPSPVGIGLKAPWDGGRDHYAGQPILILGGATSLGQYVIQFAKLSGFSPIITTASVRNTDYLKSLGATHIVDRNIPASSFASEIAKITTKSITVVFDTVAVEDTQQLGYDTLTEGGRMIISTRTSKVKEVPGSTKSVLGVFGSVLVPAHRPIGRELAQHLPALLEAGDIVPNLVEVLPGGLNGIVAGLDMLRNNLVSAKKLVVRLGEVA